MKLSLLTTLALTSAALSAPAPHAKSLVKRSFKAPAPGRSLNSPFDDINRARRKWGWSVIVENQSGYQSYDAQSTSAAAPVVVTSTYYAAPSSAPLSTASPTTGNGTNGTTPSYDGITPTTASYPSASPTGGNEDGEAVTTPEENESQYLTPVHVGGQLMNLNFDTGSADLWVFSTKLASSDIQGQSVFNPEKSSTFEEYHGASWNITYGDGSGAGGIVGFDVVDIGGSTVQKQCVELANYVSQAMLSDPNSDGLLGLAFSSINTVEPQQQKTFFENVMDDLSSPLFTADLEETNGKGTYEFGKIDKSKYSGDIHYTPVDNSEGFWSLSIPSYKIGNNTPSSTKCQECFPVIADTGTSLLYLEESIVRAYYGQIEGVDEEDGLIAAPCDTPMPDLGIQIGDWYATIKGGDMFYMQSPYAGREHMCWGGLQPTIASNMGILGDVFLKQFFAVFDGGNLRFGVAEKD
ncbi:hypothetical protein AC578_4754 [Pseudocercospora eumusae]|uniref:Peptidase A1 domain-containing protein n=1 Tax=Pseudocercospora eumusae TaxID=321146 RepID=A0A139HLL9_9PEZI|nr:hypothetical protein AC578_4754 [Pseudocercospora eumusae]